MNRIIGSAGRSRVCSHKRTRGVARAVFALSAVTLSSALLVVGCGIIRDAFEGTVTIGGVKWTAYNLDIETEDSWCYNNNTDMCENYGRLYTWDAANKACADRGNGWRLPTMEEWFALFGAAEDAMVVETGSPNTRLALKSTYGWANNDNGIDLLDFSMLPGGVRNATGDYLYAGSRGVWWSGSELDETHVGSIIISDPSYFPNPVTVSRKELGLSVRCVWDEAEASKAKNSSRENRGGRQNAQVESENRGEDTENIKYVNSTETGVLNLRAEPNASAELLFAIPHGSAVNVAAGGGTGQWVKVRYRQHEGFVNGRFLSNTEPSVPANSSIDNRLVGSWSATDHNDCGGDSFELRANGDYIDGESGSATGKWSTTGNRITTVFEWGATNTAQYSFMSNGNLSKGDCIYIKLR